ncbi:hypothetical protein DICVIV_08166 [Dictyocaulus viviparus]|uniref:Uncharacterized protein n=1 Tax=Dictyocaulus viviparus TaxID=29172 RepID=A0A0D8XMM7_DICVI|nr:hypothetical protein DICVIV_08166 [Dictyocaulus viviparus]
MENKRRNSVRLDYCPKFKGGDWNSFFHKFEAVASQSTANVARPSIVDDNVPLPIIRGHHFDIAYQETVDELVKCQVCGMLLRRAMFAAHLHQRHAELCPPSMSTDDDSGRHSGLESPDISRNPNFPFSPKLMSPSIDKDSTELAPIMKSDRKSKRRKARRERRTENESSTPKDDTVYSSPRIDPSYDDRLLSRFDDRASASAQRLRTRRDRRTYNEPNTAKDDTVHSSSKIDTSYNDRFLSQFDDRAGTSSQDLRSNFLGVLASTSRHTKAVSESCEGDDNLISRLSPSIDSVPIAHAEREESSFKKKERKSRRRTRKREHIFPSSIRSRILPVVKPINLDLASDINLVQDTSVCGQYSTNDLRDAVKGTSQSGTEVAETCSYANVRKDSKKRAPLDATLVHSTSQSLEKFAAFQNASVQLSVTVGQPAERAKPESDGIIPHIHDVSTIFSPPQLIYSQSQISYESAFIPNYKVGSNQRATGNDSLLHSEIVPSHSILKTSPVLEFESEKVLGAKSSEHCKIPDDEQNQRLLSPQKLKLFTNYQEYWKSLGVKCTAYDVVLPVVSRQDDADDATVAFLTSSPEPLSDDNCDVKEEMEEYQDRLVSDETYQSRISRYRVRQTQWISSGSSDTDQSIIVEEADSHCIANDLDDDDVRELSLEFASLSQTYQQQENANINEDIEYGTEISARLMDNNSARICNVPPPSTSRFAVENSKKCIQSEELVENLACQPSTYPSLLDETFNSLMVNRYILDSKQTQKIAEMPRITPRAPNLEVKDGLSLKEGIRVCSQQPELEMGVPIIERTPSQVSRTDANSIGVGDDNISDFFVDAPNAPQKRSREDGSSYDEDYSAEDEELVSLHENSSNYPIFLQQSGHKQLLQQPGPFFITQRVGTYESNPALARELMQSDLPREQKILQEECRKSLWSGLERPELRIQTMFEDNYSVPIQHSEPNLRSSTSTKEASYKFYERDPIEIESSLQQRKYTSHSFPSRRSREYNEVNNAVQVNRYQVQPNKGLPSRDECPVVSNGILSSHEIIPEEQGLLLHHHVPYERYEGFPKMPKHPHLLLDTREHQCNTNQTIQQTSSFIPIKRKESVGFPLNGCQNVSQQNLCYQDQLGDNTLHKQFPREEFQVFQQEKPLELMEEEMKAMRYIYLKNEQRIAKKSLAESDSRLRKNVVSPVNLMLLSQLPSIQVEPTAIPEGVSRKRMQEQILPPFYHAQFSVRNGPSVSPVNYDDVNNETDAEIQILHEVMNLELLEPPMMRPVLSKNLIEPLRDKSAPQDYQQEVALELLQPFDPRLEESRFTNQYIPTSDIGSETDMSFDESFCSYNKESSEECSDDSTDSETIRRRWDLSPSVSPLTLEAFASGLSSPDGSDSSDGQSDVPVWSTMSRKHAKIALAVCRTMPKRLQPLCRRFAWQQGITYLLENFCLQKWEIREEHDTESVWFFDKGVRRFKPFDKVPWDIPGCDETSKSDINVFYGFNICADIPIKRCRKTIRIEDRANVSLHW